uniref:dITP/XTP pyrophosphatase n=1 Tax=Paulinella micropora TaxID=1928728 RepID=A0A385I1P7_9EUKA|nr:Ham1 protein-like protein [Paulinella micropora]AXY63814.1 Ham1 protein-like protein [Paulinella micropora]
MFIKMNQNNKILMLATGNSHKVKELKKVFRELDIEISCQPEGLNVEESGSTYLENARMKAITVAKLTGYWTLADDSGLEIDALGGAPGIYSARYAPDDNQKINRILNELKGNYYRSASFNTFISLANPIGQTIIESQGICKGEILEAPSGVGPGYDSIFWVKEAGMTYARMPEHVKNKIGSRGKATKAIVRNLKCCLS